MKHLLLNIWTNWAVVAALMIIMQLLNVEAVQCNYQIALLFPGNVFPVIQIPSCTPDPTGSIAEIDNPTVCIRFRSTNPGLITEGVIPGNATTLAGAIVSFSRERWLMKQIKTTNNVNYEGTISRSLR
jgi:hypothetical protein